MSADLERKKIMTTLVVLNLINRTNKHVTLCEAPRMHLNQVNFLVFCVRNVVHNCSDTGASHITPNLSD